MLPFRRTGTGDRVESRGNAAPPRHQSRPRHVLPTPEWNSERSQDHLFSKTPRNSRRPDTGARRILRLFGRAALLRAQKFRAGQQFCPARKVKNSFARVTLAPDPGTPGKSCSIEPASRNRRLARIFHTFGFGAPIFNRLSASSACQATASRRSGLSAFRAGHEISGLGG